ncbi:MAG TPA: hypothetical protein VMV68_01025 [Spirochaetia bacterium]|nr:hypothetical protein [Spirochaetia bacterium]
MKRILIAIGLAACFATADVSALGVGGAFSLGVLGGLPNSALFSIKLDNVRPIIGIGVSIGSGAARIGGTADWWLYHQPLVGAISLYAGLGAYVDVQTGTAFNASVGARIPVGLQIFPIKPLELFVEVAPRAGIGLNPVSFPDWGVQGAFGFRFWF